MKYLGYIKWILLALGSAAIVFVAVFLYNSARRALFPNSYINVSSPAVIKELRALNRLETAAFTIEKVIDAGSGGNAFQEFLFGDKILLIAHGEVIAGIDLSTLSDADVLISGQAITLRLPAPQILTTTINNDKTRVYDRRQGLLSKGDKDLESKARLAAEQSIKAAACEGGILDEASNNAKKQLGALLKSLRFTSVTIEIPQGSC